MNININTIFARVASAFNTQMDAHLRAIAEGKQTATEAPTDRGVLLYATAGTMDYANRYTIRSYRIPGQRECTLPVTERLSVKQTEIDQAAAAYGYGLEGPPDRGYIYTLRYLPKGAIKPAANQSPAARAATANSRQAAAMTANTTTGSTTTGSVMPKNPTLLPPEQRIKVINVAGMPANSPGIWYCGRKWAGWKEGVLANQHHMKSEANRGEAAEKFDGDLFADIQRKGPMYWELVAMQRKLEAGETVTLGCWCAPKVCHCDTIHKSVLRLMAGQQPAATTPTATNKQPMVSAPTTTRATAGAAAAAATPPMQATDETPKEKLLRLVDLHATTFREYGEHSAEHTGVCAEIETLITGDAEMLNLFAEICDTQAKQAAAQKPTQAQLEELEHATILDKETSWKYGPQSPETISSWRTIEAMTKENPAMKTAYAYIVGCKARDPKENVFIATPPSATKPNPVRAAAAAASATQAMAEPSAE